MGNLKEEKYRRKVDDHKPDPQKRRKYSSFRRNKKIRDYKVFMRKGRSFFPSPFLHEYCSFCFVVRGKASPRKALNLWRRHRSRGGGRAAAKTPPSEAKSGIAYGVPILKPTGCLQARTYIHTVNTVSTCCWRNQVAREKAPFGSHEEGKTFRRAEFRMRNERK